MTMPGMLWGKIKRSPHAHARIVSINTDKAMALAGVKAVTTRADFPDIPPSKRVLGAAPANLRDLSRNCMAKGKVLYEGHAVAAVAAISPAIAEQALELIEVEYEVLPHVMDVEAAMAADAPVLHDDIFTSGVEPKPTKPSNVAKQVRFAKGDVEAGLRRGRCRHRAALYDAAGAPGLYRAACLRGFGRARRPMHDLELEPGPVHGARLHRAHLSAPTSPTSARSRPRSAAASAARRIVYLEPVAYMLSKKSGRPVKIVMSREEVFRATGPTSGAVVEVKLGAKKDGRHRPRPRPCSNTSRARFPARRSTRAACAPLRRTICRMSKSSATTC